MNVLLRPIFTRTFLFLYILCLASSIVTVPPYKDAHMYSNAPWEIFLDVYVVALLLSVIPKSVRIRKREIPMRILVKALVYLFTYTLYIVDTFCFVKFGSTLNPSMLLLMGETNGNEASEFFSSYVTADLLLSEVGVMLLIMLLHIIVAATATLFKRKRRRGRKPSALEDKWRRYTHLRGVASAAGALAVVGLLAWSATICWDNKMMFHRLMTKETIGDVEHELSAQPHAELYQPTYRFVFSVYCNELASQQLDRLMGNIGKAVVDSCEVKSPNIVVIIGESANLRHTQLYGYDKANTPNQVRLEREGSLIKMTDAVAPWNLTSYVFKHLMTTYCVGDTADWCDYPLFCELFRKAGYKVSFFTNQFLPQAKEAVYDFSGGFFINNTELSTTQFDVRNNKLHIFDEGLLSDYATSNMPHIKEEGIPTLNIFHLMGMHVNYRIRCPNSKKKWGADCYEDVKDITEKNKRVMANYDNAVWYNDSVINQIIERFKDDETVIVYFSDHGEEVFGPGARHFFGRMHKTEITKRLADEEFRIPMWIYCSPKYARKHPDVVKSISEAKDKPYMSDAVSHLLLGLAGINCKYYNPRYDLLSPQYDSKRKRLLKHAVDYDKL